MGFFCVVGSLHTPDDESTPPRRFQSHKCPRKLRPEGWRRVEGKFVFSPNALFTTFDPVYVNEHFLVNMLVVRVHAPLPHTALPLWQRPHSPPLPPIAISSTSSRLLSPFPLK